MSLLFAVVKKLEAYLEKREQQKNLAVAKSALSQNVRDLEGKLSDLKDLVYTERKKGWKDQWQAIEDVSYNLGKLGNISTAAHSTDLEGKAREYKNYVQNIKGIQRSLSALEPETKKLDGSTPIEEYRALEDFTETLLEANNAKGKKVNYAAVLKSFESQHKGSNIAHFSKFTRLWYFADPATNKDAMSYIRDVATKSAANPPVYTSVPEGTWLSSKSKWKSDFDTEKFKLDAKYNRLYIAWPRLKLECRYTGNKISPIGLIKQSGSKDSKDVLSVKCFVTEKAPADVRNFVESFNSDLLVPYIYETDTKELTYNKSNPVAAVFAGYFKRDGILPVAKEAVLRIISEDSTVKYDALRKLRFSEKSIEKLSEDNFLWPTKGGYRLTSQSFGNWTGVGKWE